MIPITVPYWYLMKKKEENLKENNVYLRNKAYPKNCGRVIRIHYHCAQKL